jgi:hypothetical protein
VTFSDNLAGQWSAWGKPFEEIINKIKANTANHQPEMSVLETIIASILSKAIAAGYRHDIKEPDALAAYITGYLASMRMMPREVL